MKPLALSFLPAHSCKMIRPIELPATLISFCAVVFSADIASACLCWKRDHSMQASVEAKEHAAALGLSIHQQISNDGVSTAYKIIDPLNGPLDGSIEILEPNPNSSCSSGVTVGMLRPISVSLNSEKHEEKVCEHLSTELNMNYQLTGEDATLWSYDDCVTVDPKNRSNTIINSAPECVTFSDDNFRSGEILAVIRRAVEKIRETYNYDIEAGWIRRQVDLTQYGSVHQLESDYYVFFGSPTVSELRPDGTIWTTYRVKGDFGQFLSETISVKADGPWAAYNPSPFIIVNCKTGELMSGSDKDLVDVGAAFADWMINKKNWSIPLKTCITDCGEDEFDSYAFKTKFETEQTLKKAGDNISSGKG